MSASRCPSIEQYSNAMSNYPIAQLPQACLFANCFLRELLAGSSPLSMTSSFFYICILQQGRQCTTVRSQCGGDLSAELASSPCAAARSRAASKSASASSSSSAWLTATEPGGWCAFQADCQALTSQGFDPSALTSPYNIRAKHQSLQRHTAFVTAFNEHAEIIPYQMMQHNDPILSFVIR